MSSEPENYERDAFPCVNCADIEHKIITDLRTEIAAMLPVVEAALATVSVNGWHTHSAATLLCPAVDAYREATND